VKTKAYTQSGIAYRRRVAAPCCSNGGKVCCCQMPYYLLDLSVRNGTFPSLPITDDKWCAY